jgi:hypothetical protein
MKPFFYYSAIFISVIFFYGLFHEPAFPGCRTKEHGAALFR